MIDLLKKYFHYPLYKTYLVVLFFLSYGLFYESEFRYIHYLIFYSVLFIASFELLKRSKLPIIIEGLKNRHKSISLPNLTSVDSFLNIVSLLIIILIVAHFVYLRQIPMLSAWRSINYDWIVNLRHDITAKSSTFWVYTNSFLIRAILPFFIWYSYTKNKKVAFILLLFFGSFYAIALLQKSFILTILLPLTLSSFFKKNYLIFFSSIVIIVSSINFLVFVTNPELRSKNYIPSSKKHFSDLPSKTKGPNKNKYIRSFESIRERLIIIPGKMVSDWFKLIPEKKPYLNGCGYRFLAPFLGCEFREYSLELYPLIYPEYAKRGYSGTVNVANFMYEYSNFGLIGLVISAVSLAFLIFFVEHLFKDDFEGNVSINLYYILVLSSSALTTLLFTGGWGIMLILYIILKKN